MANCNQCMKLMRLQQELNKRNSHINNLMGELSQYKKLSKQQGFNLNDVQNRASFELSKLKSENCALRKTLDEQNETLNKRRESKRNPIGTPKFPNWDIGTLRTDELY
jgi:vacuolar-type H+-ATPase subunit I/STV1